MAFQFKNRVALVTGAGGGIGLAVARALASEGAIVEAIDVKTPDLIDELPSNFHFSNCDLTKDEEVCAAFQRLEAKHGKLNYVVNCAGICLFERDGSVVDSDDNILNLTLDVNLKGVIRVVRAAVPLLKLTTGGAMVHIASVVGIRNMENIIDGGPADAYQLSKAAVISLSRSLAMQLAPAGIRSNTVCPGAVSTPMTSEIYDQSGRIAKMEARTPLGRIANPEDISNAVLFLLSDQAKFITGIDLPVDGGLLAKL